MAITLGTNGYISVADFKAWAAQRGYELFDYLDSDIEASITISNLDYIDNNYTFKGTSVSDTQQMQLPTDEVVIADVLNCAAQATWQQLQGLLFVTQTTASATGDIILQRSKLDVLEKETEYAEGTARNFTYNTSMIARLLSKFIIGGGAQSLRA